MTFSGDMFPGPMLDSACPGAIDGAALEAREAGAGEAEDLDGCMRSADSGIDITF
jgi:hypothetical protein